MQEKVVQSPGEQNFINHYAILFRAKERPKPLLLITYSSQLIWRCEQSGPELCWSNQFRCRTRNQFHEVVVQCDTSFSIEHGSANFAVEIGRYNVVFGVTQNAFHCAFRSRFDCFLDFFVGRCFSRRTVRSTTDTFGVGTRNAIPVSLPFSSGSTLPTALAAPVEDGMMFCAARGRRASLCETGHQRFSELRW